MPRRKTSTSSRSRPFLLSSLVRVLFAPQRQRLNNPGVGLASLPELFQGKPVVPVLVHLVEDLVHPLLWRVFVLQLRLLALDTRNKRQEFRRGQKWILCCLDWLVFGFYKGILNAERVKSLIGQFSKRDIVFVSGFSAQSSEIIKKSIFFLPKNICFSKRLLILLHF